MTEIEPAGLDYWMEGVLRECDHLRHDFAPVPVHDLRVTLRRCRSIANGFMAFDPHPAWKLMKTESRRLFQQLGALRDTQVMAEWINRIAPEPDEAALILGRYLENEEKTHKENAAEALLAFDQKKWASWTRVLSGRARKIPLESVAFQHLALERLYEARDLHRRAIRNRSQAQYHRLRIALKKFRYTLENFLPSRHEKWGQGLREIQDLLGEMHDLFVLWRTAMAIKAVRDEKTRSRWHQRISEENGRRLQIYREKMAGKSSLFDAWLSEFLQSGEIRDTALVRLRVWASYRDPDISHSEHVARLALQICDGLESLDLISANTSHDARWKLEAAARMHSIGSGEMKKKSHMAAYRSIRKLPPPLGLTAEDLRKIALVVRFHRGALPRRDQKALSGISEDEQVLLILLSGILRLADAFDRLHGRRINRLDLKRSGDILYINAPGYTATDSTAGRLAAARHLLEMATGHPILIR